jgi:hypothetical protein
MSVLDFNQTFAEIRIPRSQLLRELGRLIYDPWTLLAGASLPHLFFDYLGQGFELGAKPIKMLFVPFRFSKQLWAASAGALLDMGA